MEITVVLEHSLKGYSTGGGYRTSTGEITIDASKDWHEQRETLIHEWLGLMYDNIIPRELRENAAGVLNDLLDQWEGLNERLPGRITTDAARQSGKEDVVEGHI